MSDHASNIILGLIIGVFAVMMLCSCASAPAAAPCPSLKSAYPHTSLEQSVLADELPNDGSESQRWISEYVTIRAAGDLVCPAPK